MINPKTKLVNYFYFVNDNIIFNISNYNDSDKCGHQVVKTADTQEESDELNALIFPNIKVEYIQKDNSVAGVKYYWLQPMIKDGDTVETDGDEIKKFKYTHTGNGYGKAFMEGVLSDVGIYAVNGYTIEKIKQVLPFYVFESSINNADAGIKINNKEVIVTAITISNEGETVNLITDNDLKELVYKEINKRLYKYANGLLEPHGKQLKTATQSIKINEENKIVELIKDSTIKNKG